MKKKLYFPIQRIDTEQNIINLRVRFNFLLNISNKLHFSQNPANSFFVPENQKARFASRNFSYLYTVKAVPYLLKAVSELLNFLKLKPWKFLSQIGIAPSAPLNNSPENALGQNGAVLKFLSDNLSGRP